MKLYTFIVEIDGDTFCSQHSGVDYKQAALQFVDYAISFEGLNSGATTREKLADSALDIVPLKNMVNAFCASHSDPDDCFWLITVIETVPKTQKELEE